MSNSDDLRDDLRDYLVTTFWRGLQVHGEPSVTTVTTFFDSLRGGVGARARCAIAIERICVCVKWLKRSSRSALRFKLAICGLHQVVTLGSSVVCTMSSREGFGGG